MLSKEMHDKYVIEHYNNLVVEQSRFYQHRGQTFAHVRIVFRVEVFLQDIQGSAKALLLLFG